MIGIVSYGAYIPYHRLDRKLIAQAWSKALLPGEKAVANFDEDCITMCAAAGMDCLRGFDPKNVDALFLATTSSPYREKLAAATVASALDLRPDARIADFTNSVRSGTIALSAALDAVKAGSVRNVLVVAADTRSGAPQSTWEQLFGDGAGAILVGDSQVVATIDGSYSAFNEFFDIWRTSEDVNVRSGEDRFILSEGYVKIVQQAIAGLAKKYSLTPKDITKAVLYSPDFRSYLSVAASLGIDLKTQLQDPLFTTVGHTGSASVFMTLVSALEGATPGDRILLANYGDGSDVFILTVTDELKGIENRRGIKGHLKPKFMLPSYEKYLRWREIITLEEAPKRPPRSTPSLPGLWRQKKRILALYGQKCQ